MTVAELRGVVEGITVAVKGFVTRELASRDEQIALLEKRLERLEQAEREREPTEAQR